MNCPTLSDWVTTQMLKHCFFTGGIAQTNGWLLETPEGALAVDAPEGMARWLRLRGVKLTALLLTHQHFDHVQDAAAVKAEHGCPIHAFAPYSRALTLEDLFGVATGMSVSVPPYTVDHLLEGQDALSVARITFDLKHVPGHSPDSVCFHAAEHGILMGGDVLFAGSIGRCDFPGGSQRQLVQGIAEKLMILPDATRVLPGHGPETTIAAERSDNPYL